MENSITQIAYGLLFLVTWVGAVSCTVSTPSFSTATAGQEMAYMAKPLSTDTTKSATYISGAVGLGSMYDGDDRNTSGEISLHRSHAFKYGNLAYGAHGFLGTYKVTKIDDFTGRKTFHGYGFRGSANINLPFAYSDWRVIGVEGAITCESGTYTSFKKEAAVNGQLIDLHPNKNYTVLGLRSEYIREIPELENMRLGLSVGYFWILEERNRMIFLAPYMEFYKACMSMVVCANNNAGSIVFRLSYRL